MMVDATDPMRKAGSAPLRGAWTLAAFLGLVAVYLITAPAHHSLSVDAYYYALMITRDPVTDVQNPRLFLWLVSMKALYQSADAIVPGIDVFRVIAWANAVIAAFAVVFFARLLERGFSLRPAGAWLTAALFASSYGFWRYATEIEVYASAVLICLLIAHATIALDRAESGRGGLRAIGLGILGGIGTLFYQPIGVLTVFAVPGFLLVRRRFLALALYGAVAGIITIGGFGLAHSLGTGAELPAAEFVFQTHHLVPSVPSLSDVAKMAFAIGHDLLSAQWMFAVEPLRERFRLAQGFFLHDEHRFAAQNAGLLIWAAVVTLPSAAILGLLGIATALKFPGRRFDAHEFIMVIWLLTHGAMMLILAPLGFEGWIPGLVPLFVLAALRLIGPCIVAGRMWIVLALVAVFVLHNGLAGIGVQMRGGGDYLGVRGKALIERSGPGDLIVLAAHQNLERYLRFSDAAPVVVIERDGSDAARDAIEETLAKGGHVLVLDDVDRPKRYLNARRWALVPGIEALVRDYLGPAQRFETGRAGFAYEILPQGATQ